MARDDDTIFALSSGALPSGVAVVRLSGRQTDHVIEAIAGTKPAHGQMALRTFRDDTGKVLDRGLLVVFEAPRSFTGEAVAEFHLHGGKAVVTAFLEALSIIAGLRAAEPGEFTRRAFLNGKVDLTELEGLSDLVASETEMQRRQAVSLSGGLLRERYSEWRDKIIRLRALIEAEIDFADEDDVPGGMSGEVWGEAAQLKATIEAVLAEGGNGEIIRDGFKVALMGRPNAGKSSLLNALAKRDVAIVTDEAGTTRDLLEVRLDLGGYLVRMYDTAGIREASSSAEMEGIRRAKRLAEEADLIIWLSDGEHDDEGLKPIEAPTVLVRSKADKGDDPDFSHSISIQRPETIDRMMDLIRDEVGKRAGFGDDIVFSRVRHRQGLARVAAHLAEIEALPVDDLDRRSECLRLASVELGRLTGAVDVEDLLDVIFSEFCIGK